MYLPGILVAIIISLIGGFTSITHAATLPAPYEATEIITKVNEARDEVGLKSLITNTQLTEAAQNRANDMADKRYFSHTNLNNEPFWSEITRSGYQYLYAGENLAIFYKDTDKMVTAWLNSPSHRANIMNQNFTETGIGIARGNLGGFSGWFVVQLFGTTY